MTGPLSHGVLQVLCPDIYNLRLDYADLGCRAGWGDWKGGLVSTL